MALFRREMALSETQTESLPAGFDAIEVHKENLQPLREARSTASVLAKVVTTNSTLVDTRDSLKTEMEKFEKQIADTSDLDDPLEPYLLYIKLILNRFPQGDTAESGLIQLLEICTSAFRDAPYYKDDPRYLGVWMRYVMFSNAPREMFIYLAKKEIGRNLATFYEEYASYLEKTGSRRQAKEVYEAGINASARPIERLRRKFREFSERFASNPPDPNEPTSPALPAVPAVRSALSVKQGESPVTSVEKPAQVLSGWGPPTTSSPNQPKGAQSKLAIFKDSVSSIKSHVVL